MLHRLQTVSIIALHFREHVCVCLCGVCVWVCVCVRVYVHTHTHTHALNVHCRCTADVHDIHCLSQKPFVHFAENLCQEVCFCRNCKMVLAGFCSHTRMCTHHIFPHWGWQFHADVQEAYSPTESRSRRFPMSELRRWWPSRRNLSVHFQTVHIPLLCQMQRGTQKRYTSRACDASFSCRPLYLFCVSQFYRRTECPGD